jgi:phenylpropionate dioxygenase-like ring-hydroxylating dioxygenase large terminal subunit
MRAEADGYAGLVDVAGGRVSRRVFADPAVYEAELDRVFGRCWLYVGHTSEVPRPGDYVTRSLGDDPVIFCRDQGGALHVFLNACAHRGTQLCRADAGNLPAYTCAYHGWTFGNDGRLIAAAEDLSAYEGFVDARDFALVEARVGSYHGLVFATFDRDAPPLEEYLGDARWYLDLFFGRTPGGIEVLAPPTRWMADKNWKLGPINFGADGPHAIQVHGPITRRAVGLPTALLVELTQAAPTICMGNGHIGVMLMAGESLGMPEFIALPPELREEYRRTLGEPRAGMLGRMVTAVFTVFPNLSWVYSMISFDPDQLPTTFFCLRTWNPRSPSRTEVHSWCLADREASDDYKARSLRAGIATFTPAGMFDQDDAEVWASMSRAAQGRIGRTQRSSFERIGAARRRPTTDFPGPGRAYHGAYSEISEFDLLVRWQELMAA